MPPARLCEVSLCIHGGPRKTHYKQETALTDKGIEQINTAEQGRS